MMDLFYVALTVGFFAAMLGYTRACDRVGRRDERTSNR